jgi:hypothetical protein
MTRRVCGRRLTDVDARPRHGEVVVTVTDLGADAGLLVSAEHALDETPGAQAIP